MLKMLINLIEIIIIQYSKYFSITMSISPELFDGNGKLNGDTTQFLQSLVDTFVDLIKGCFRKVCC